MRLRKPKKNIEFELLLEDIRQTKLAMDVANSRFDYAVEPDLIDCYIYEVNSIHKRYKHLLERAKELDITCNTPVIKEHTIF